MILPPSIPDLFARQHMAGAAQLGAGQWMTASAMAQQQKSPSGLANLGRLSMQIQAPAVVEKMQIEVNDWLKDWDK